MRNLIIVGSGAVAAELTAYIEDSNKYLADSEKWAITGYLDAEENISKYWAKYKHDKPVLSDVYSYAITGNESFIVGISNISFRRKMTDVLIEKGADIISFIHPGAIVAKSAILGRQNIVYPFCIIGPNAVIGDNNLFTSYSFISHDCKVGNDNFFSTAGLSGHVAVGNENYFGIRATVLPNVSIGNRNTIQAGMTVDKNVPDDSLIFHRFKEKVLSIGNPRKDV